MCTSKAIDNSSSLKEGNHARDNVWISHRTCNNCYMYKYVQCTCAVLIDFGNLISLFPPTF